MTGTAVPAKAKSAGDKAAPSGRAATGARGRADDGKAKDRAARADRSRPAPPTRPVRPLPPWLDRFGGNEPGGRWVLLSFATILVASVWLSFVHIVPDPAANPKDKTASTKGVYTIWHLGFAKGLIYLLPPIIVVGVSIVLGARSDRRRHWNTALVLLIFMTFLLGSLQMFMVSILCLGWGCWQARKAALAEFGGDAQALRTAERERRIEARAARRSGR